MEVAKSNKAQPSKQSDSQPDHHAPPSNSAQASSRSPHPNLHEGYSGRDYESYHENPPHGPPSMASSRLEKHTEQTNPYSKNMYHGEEATSNWWEVENPKSENPHDTYTQDEESFGPDYNTTSAGEPPSYTVATQSEKSSPQFRRSLERGSGEHTPRCSMRSGGLELPVIVPQRRPEDKSRGWMLCYAPVLESCDISQTEFLDFLTSFNKSSQVCSTPVTKAKVPCHELTVIS